MTRIEYMAVDKGALNGKRGIELELPELGANGWAFSFETPLSWVFQRPAAEAPPEPEDRPKPRA